MKVKDSKIIHYVVPNVPLYVYFSLSEEKRVFCVPLIAYGCWWEDEINQQAPLVIEEGWLCNATLGENYLEVSPDKDMKWEDFFEEGKEKV